MLRRLALVAVCFAALAGLVAGLAGCAVPAATAARGAAVGTAPALPAGSAHLVVYGDSVSVGANQERPVAAWPLQVARALGDDAPRVYGMPGFTAGQIDAALAASGIRTGPAAALVVEAGTNDLVMHTPLAAFTTQYPRLLDDALASAAGAPRLVCLGAWHDSATAAPYDATIRDTCVARGGTFVPLAALYMAAGMRSPNDGFHPSTDGQAAIAALVAQAIAG